MQQRFLLQILLLAQHVSGHHYAHHQELKSIIHWLLPVVFGFVYIRKVTYFTEVRCDFSYINTDFWKRAIIC